MKILIYSLVACVLAGCTSIASKAAAPVGTFSVADAPAGYSPDNPMFQFAGTWEGTLDGHSGPNLIAGAGTTRTYRIVITPQETHVFEHGNAGWTEAKKGTFRISYWGPQAIVSSSTSGRDSDGTWVEGWSFTLVHQSANEVVAYWVRTVNNLELAPDNEYFHFAWEFSGAMRRIGE